MSTTTANNTFNNEQAITEGWLITNIEDQDSPLQLLKDDETNVFDTDVQAWEFVYAKAKAGSEYHYSAFAFLREEHYSEWLSMVEYLHGEKCYATLHAEQLKAVKAL